MIDIEIKEKELTWRLQIKKPFGLHDLYKHIPAV